MPTLVQVKNAKGSGTSVTVNCAATGAGHFLLLVIAEGGAANPTFTVTAPASGTTGETVVRQNTFNNESGQLWYDQNCAAGITSVTITSSVSMGGCSVWLMEFSGCDTSASPIDVYTATAPATYSASPSTSVTTTQAGDLVVGFIMSDTGNALGTPAQPASPWVSLGAYEQDLAGWESTQGAYQVQTSAGSITYNPTQTVSQDYILWLIAIKASSSGTVFAATPDSVTLSDSVAITRSASPSDPGDTLTALVEAAGSTASAMPAADATTLADGVNLSGGAALADALTLADGLSGAASAAPAADTLALTDGPGLGGSPTLVDTLTLTDSTSGSGVAGPTDGLALGDAEAGAASLSAPAEAVALADGASYSSSGSSFSAVPDTLTLSDSVVLASALTPPAEVLAVADVPLVTLGASPPADGLVVADALTLSSLLSWPDMVTLLETPVLASVLGPLLDGSLTLADSVVLISGTPAVETMVVIAVFADGTATAVFADGTATARYMDGNVTAVFDG